MSQIMSYDEYLRSPNAKIIPYSYTLGLPPHVVTMVGLNHSQDVQHPQFAVLKGLWETFMARVDPTRAMVATEARVPSITTSQEDGIRHSGESGFMSFLAYEAGVPLKCFEPELKEQFDLLRQEFSVDDILFYYTERVVAQYFRTDQTESVEDYLAGYMERNKSRLGPKAEHYTWDYFLKMMPDYGLTGFHAKDAELWLRLGNPTLGATQCNRVARSSSIQRDKHIADMIIQKYNEGHSLFVTYGSTHVVMQEPYLRTYLEPSKENNSQISS